MTRSKRPNLLLITTDQQRWDTLGVNGNRVLKTTHLDALAARGVNFTRAYSTVPSCIAARRSILTGQHGATHGMVGYEDGTQYNPIFTLPSLLGDAGYQTQLIGKLHQFPQGKRFGFDHIVLSEQLDYRPSSIYFGRNDYVDWLKVRAGSGAEPGGHGLGPNSRLARPFHLDEELHQTSFLVHAAIEFLTRRRDPACPWFLHLSFWAPHPPLVPPKAYWDRYCHRDDLKPVIGGWAPKDRTPKPGLAPDAAVGPFDAEEIRQTIAGYYASIHHIDNRINHLFERAFQRGSPTYDEPLYVLFTTDHGEMLGDHHLFRKSLGYEGSAHIPFVLSGRNVEPTASTSDALVCLEDILPTLLDLAGVPVPEPIDGRSLAGFVLGDKPATRDVLFGEHSNPFRTHYVVSGKHKYIWYAGTNEEQLFDLETDPRETTDLSGSSELLAPMRRLLAERVSKRDDYRYHLEALKPLAGALPSVFWS
ncbi:MAG TPA: sulfatase-like hydrolase/transferase [Polyangiaceae bacterium]